MRPCVRVHKLKANGKWQFLKDLAEAPTSDLDESVYITGKPVGAV